MCLTSELDTINNIFYANNSLTVIMSNKVFKELQTEGHREILNILKAAR